MIALQSYTIMTKKNTTNKNNNTFNTHMHVHTPTHRQIVLLGLCLITLLFNSVMVN